MNPLVFVVPAVLLLALAGGGRKKKRIIEPTEPERKPPEPEPEPEPAPPPPPPPTPSGPTIADIQGTINQLLADSGYQTIPVTGRADPRTCGAYEMLTQIFGFTLPPLDCSAITPPWPHPNLVEQPGARDAAELTFLSMIDSFRAACEPQIGEQAAQSAIAQARGQFDAQAAISQFDTALMAAEGELRSACPSWGGVL